MQTKKSSENIPKRRNERRSAPRRSSPPGVDGEGAGLAGLYLQLFGRPPLGDHPKLDGYTAGRVLAEEYPDEMMRVMQGFREGVKAGTELVQEARGEGR